MLIAGINVENALDVIVLADMHNSSTLKEVAKKFIVKESAKIAQQDRWWDKLNRFPTIAKDVFGALMAKE